MTLKEIRSRFKALGMGTSKGLSPVVQQHDKDLQYLLDRCEQLQMDLASQKLDMQHCIESKDLRIKKLEEALRFYADKKHNVMVMIPNVTMWSSEPIGFEIIDHGQRARQSLTDEEGG